MRTGFWILLLVISAVPAGCLVGTAGAVALTTDWKERPSTEYPFQGVAITPDGSVVYAGGYQMYVRSWDRQKHWGGRSGQIAAMSTDANHTVTALGNTVYLLDKDGVENWSRTMGGQVTAVAVSPNGSFVISADDRGNYNAWGPNGEYIARNSNRTAKKVAIARTGDLVAALTDQGIRVFSKKLDDLWIDNRTETERDALLLISDDGSTIITVGDTQVASYGRDGTLNWRKDITREPIIDIACSSNCSTIVVAGQEKNVVALDRFGSIHWKYPIGQWVNAVGISGDGSVIAAGGIDHTVYILDHSGTLVAKKPIDAIIQQRSIAVSSNGKHIAVADQIQLYGFSLIGEIGSAEEEELSAIATISPVLTTYPATIATTLPATLPEPENTTVTAEPMTTGTQRSPADPILVLPAIGAAVLIGCRRR